MKGEPRDNTRLYRFIRVCLDMADEADATGEAPSKSGMGCRAFSTTMRGGAAAIIRLIEQNEESKCRREYFENQYNDLFTTCEKVFRDETEWVTELTDDQLEQVSELIKSFYGEAEKVEG